MGGDWSGCSGLFWRAPPRALAAHCIDLFLKPHHLQPILSMKRGRKQSRCTDCKKKKRRCTPDHLIEELPGEGESKDEEGEAEWKDDPLAPIRRLALPGLGAGIRDFDLPGVDAKRYDF